MAYVTPRTWSTGDDVTAARANQDLRDNVAFLATSPSCRVFNSANISHTTTATDQFLTFNSERFDTDTMHSTASLTGRIVFTTAGKYLVGGDIEFAANATGQRGIGIRLNATTYIAAGPLVNAAAAGTTRLTIVTYYQFAAADYVELAAYQSSGGVLNVVASGNYTPEFWASWQSL